MRTALSLALLLSACGSRVFFMESQNQRSTSSLSQKNTAEQNPDENKAWSPETLAEFDKFQQRNLSEDSELSLLLAVNQKYCERINQKTRSCVVDLKLAAQEMKLLGCQVDAAAESMNVTYDVEFSGAAGTYRLIAENTFLSSVFSASGKITWTSTVDGSNNGLRIRDVAVMQLKRIDGTMPSLETFAFALKANGKVVLTKADLLMPEVADNTYYRFNMQPLLALRSQAECSVNSNEVDDLLKAEIEKSLDLKKKRLEKASDVIEQIQAVKSEIGERTPILERERDRSGKLRAELLKNEIQGCFANMPIDKIEVLVNGSLDAGQHRIGKEGHRIGNYGNANRFNFVIGDNFGFVNDEAALALFQPNGQKIIAEQSGRKISALDRLSIGREGSEFYNNRVKEGGVFGIGEKTRYEWFEIKRHSLNAVTILVNGQILYKRVGIQKTFRHNDAGWSDPLFKANEYYTRLMLRSDCGQSK
jgi:hypothetical protein